MSDDKEKVGHSDEVQPSYSVHAADDYYDPMQESTLTRLGLTKESFKRAPGTTRYVLLAGAVR